MRKYISFILFALNTTVVFSQVCCPTFKKIFDFNKGDYFEYEMSNGFVMS